MKNMVRSLSAAWLAVAMATAGCEGSDDETDPTAGFTVLDPSICAPEGGPFTAAVDNSYFPLPAGLRLILEGDDEGTAVRVEITVLDEIEEVAGVETRVVEEAEYEDGEVIEISRNFFVQAPDGTVCYYGEDVDIYEGGQIASHDGAWRAGEGGAQPGIVMPGDPQPGTKFAQENAPGVAEDMSAIMEVGVPISVAAGDFADTVHAIDWNPGEGESAADAEDKYFAAGIGQVVDDVLDLVDWSLPE